MRNRLLIFIAVCITFFGLLPLFSVPHLLGQGQPRSVYVYFGIQWTLALVVLALGLIVWRWPGLSLRSLRWIEMLVIVPVTAFVALGNAYLSDKYSWLEIADGVIAHPVISPTVTRLDPYNLRWFVLIVGYGALIPNSWRRCAAVVGTMAALWMLVFVIQALGSGVDRSMLPGLLLYPLVWMAMAVVVAVFGSYRINALQRQVYEARKLGQYLLKRRLGAGGMGEVYLAEHLHLQQPCAVKLIRPERAGDANTLRRFEREVQATAALKHPNAVNIHDYGRAADGTLYYVMEYLPGFDLNELVREFGPLPASRVIHLLRQVCGPLHEAHGMGLIHRDIKPHNIIACERGGIADVAKLLDFGLVKDLSRNVSDAALTREGVVAGTPAYMSPEQVAGNALDERTDIYSLGAVGYFLLAGQPPFADLSPQHVLAAKLLESPPPLEQFCSAAPADLVAVISRCLSRDANERYPDTQSLDRALAACSSAGQWNREAAANWWRINRRENEASHSSRPHAEVPRTPND